MLAVSAYCNEARLIEVHGRPAIQGNPTEGALVVAAAKAGISRAELKEQQHETVEKFPFDSTRKMMSMLVRLPTGEHVLAAKDAPDVILSRASEVLLHGEELELTPERRVEIEKVIEGFGEDALRTLAIAYKRVDDDPVTSDADDYEQDVVLLGIHGIMDPPRPEVPGAVAEAASAGVNDAPVLRAADIGVAMGIAGTSVAKDSASLVLLDDNFSTIVTAVREGRRIYDNMLKFIRQALTANVAEVSAILFAFLLMGADPLLTLIPLMILWVNLVSDGVPALTLGLEPAEDDIMRREPRHRHESIFAGGLGQRIIVRGLALGGLSYWLLQQALDAGNSLAYAQTMALRP